MRDPPFLGRHGRSYESRCLEKSGSKADLGPIQDEYMYVAQARKKREYFGHPFKVSQGNPTGDITYTPSFAIINQSAGSENAAIIVQRAA